MKSPFTNKEMTLKTEKRFLTLHGKVYEKNYSFYLCEDTKEQFTTTELDELNLKHIYMKNFKLIIPCYFENEASIKNQNLKLESDITIYDIKDVTIYQLPFALSPYAEKGKECGCRVHVGNEYFISTMSIQELEILIDLELSK